MKKNIFEFNQYKLYLSAVLGGPKVRTGLRMKAAKRLKCQTSYISQVLNGKAHISLEQAYTLNEFLGHDEEESDYFLLLVQKDRAGTQDLKNYFLNQLNAIIQKRLVIRNRIKQTEFLSSDDQSIYYSKWYYSCIHVLLSIPRLQTKEELARALHLPLSTVTDVLQFLESRGLAKLEQGKYQIGPRHIHLPHDSPHISKHHHNWRTRALVSLDTPQKDDLHYSVVMTMSHEDMKKIKEQMVKVVQESLKMIAPSKEEVAFALSFDYFQIYTTE